MLCPRSIADRIPPVRLLRSRRLPRVTLLSLLSLLLLSAALPVAAQASCSSDGVPRPVAVLERFVNADCETCWQDRATPAPRRGELAIDWVLPGGKGDDAALAVAARPEALERVQALERKPPLASDAVRLPLPAQPRAARLRIAQGASVNDYIAVSVDLAPGRTPPRGGPFQLWLLLVESLPRGTEGSPVARKLVRNVFTQSWDPAAVSFSETRAMQIHEGVRPSRLRVVALLQDANGRLLDAAETRCDGR
ncbi:MAG: hypothetical protein AB7E83_04805 [Ramlibacter sp.]